MDNRNPQDKHKHDPKLNPNERNQSEQKHAGSQDRDRMEASKKAGQQDNQRNPQQKH